jgi:hypothetical protein
VDDISGLTLLQAADLVTLLKVRSHYALEGRMDFDAVHITFAVAVKHHRNCDAHGCGRSGRCCCPRG